MPICQAAHFEIWCALRTPSPPLRAVSNRTDRYQLWRKPVEKAFVKGPQLIIMSSLEDVVKCAEICMKSEKYTEAFFHWTKAIHMSEQKGIAATPHMYAQRAKCFMSSDQFYYAMEDAKRVIEIEPSHPLGHLRLAEVFYETGHFIEALPEINRCFQLAPSKLEKDHLLEWQKKCRKNAQKQKLKDEQLPYVGAAIGIIFDKHNPNF